jgi:gluconate 5-dehydrogenase
VSDLFDLSGRTALVTGSTRGLGFALARGLAGAGARVAINGRTQESCEAAAAELDGAFAAPFDVTDEESVAAGVAAIGQVDILVNNARRSRSSRSRTGSACSTST